MKNVISLKVRILGSNPFLTREYISRAWGPVENSFFLIGFATPKMANNFVISAMTHLHLVNGTTQESKFRERLYGYQ
jgi:hypothetical protein